MSNLIDSKDSSSKSLFIGLLVCLFACLFVFCLFFFRFLLGFFCLRNSVHFEHQNLPQFFKFSKRGNKGDIKTASRVSDNIECPGKSGQL